jgi:hypothetical protein
VLLRDCCWSFVRDDIDIWLEILYNLDHVPSGGSFERRHLSHRRTERNVVRYVQIDDDRMTPPLREQTTAS